MLLLPVAHGGAHHKKKKKTGASHGNFLKPEEEDSAHRWMAQYHSSKSFRKRSNPRRATTAADAARRQTPDGPARSLVARPAECSTGLLRGSCCFVPVGLEPFRPSFGSVFVLCPRHAHVLLP